MRTYTKYPVIMICLDGYDSFVPRAYQQIAHYI